MRIIPQALNLDELSRTDALPEDPRGSALKCFERFLVAVVFQYAWRDRLVQDIPSQYTEYRALRTTPGTLQITVDAKTTDH